jgi:transcriptional regulator with XRE-family HTH domain
LGFKNETFGFHLLTKYLSKRGVFLYPAYIKAHKEAKKLKVKDLVEMTKIPESTINNFLSGKTENPSFEIVSKLCIAVGGSLDEMVGLKEIAESKKEEVNFKEIIASITASFTERLELYKERIAELKEDNLNDKKEKKILYAIIIALIVIEFILGMF